MTSIRPAVLNDADTIAKIFDSARVFMRSYGNIYQWPDNMPPTIETIHEDIEKGQSYVAVSDAGEILAVFCFIKGPDRTYNVIFDGHWLDDDDYYVIHRIASSGAVKGMGEFCLNWCFSQFPNIRIDTHEINKPMRSVLERIGFVYCGIVYVADGSERIAYQRHEKSGRDALHADPPGHSPAMQ